MPRLQPDPYAVDHRKRDLPQCKTILFVRISKRFEEKKKDDGRYLKRENMARIQGEGNGILVLVVCGCGLKERSRQGVSGYLGP
eukprot:2456820-Rhodomonas_salina.1